MQNASSQSLTCGSRLRTADDFLPISLPAAHGLQSAMPAHGRRHWVKSGISPIGFRRQRKESHGQPSIAAMSKTEPFHDTELPCSCGIIWSWLSVSTARRRPVQSPEGQDSTGYARGYLLDNPESDGAVAGFAAVDRAGLSCNAVASCLVCPPPDLESRISNRQCVGAWTSSLGASWARDTGGVISCPILPGRLRQMRGWRWANARQFAPRRPRAANALLDRDQQVLIGRVPSPAEEVEVRTAREKVRQRGVVNPCR